VSDTLTAIVKRTWQGQGGVYFAQVSLEQKRDLATVYSAHPFEEGQRVEVERTREGYRLKEMAEG